MKEQWETHKDKFGNTHMSEKKRRLSCTLNSMVKWLTKPSFVRCIGDYLLWWLSVICVGMFYALAATGAFWAITWLIYNLAT